jgi:N-acetylmuramoyl-L-alanine amidase
VVLATALATVLALIAIDRACTLALPSGEGASPGAQAPNGPTPEVAQAALAPGACKTQEPTGRSRGQIVFVDAGHGGIDPGVTARTTSGATVKESTVALAVATQLSGLLRAQGYRVVLSRTADTMVARFPPEQLQGGAIDADHVRQDLLARARCADDAHATLLVSIHFNGYDDASVGGTQTIYDAARPFADGSQRLAQSLQSALVSSLGRADRGILTDDGLNAPTLSDRADVYGHLLLLGPAEPGYLDRPTTMPGALVEPLFLTDPAEADVAASPAGQRRIASALAAGIQAFRA